VRDVREDALKCEHCSRELERHPLLGDTWTCRQCDIDHDSEGCRINRPEIFDEPVKGQTRAV